MTGRMTGLPTLFQHNCPYCMSRSAGFRVSHQWPDKLHYHVAHFLAICGVCNQGITGKSMFRAGDQHPSLTGANFEFPGQQFILMEVWPELKDDLPSGIPNNVASFYKQGLENLNPIIPLTHVV